MGRIDARSSPTAARVTLGKSRPARVPRATRPQARASARVEIAARAFTVGQLITRWAADHRASRKPGYAAEAEWVLRRALASMLDFPAAKLDRGGALAPLQAGKGITAARVMAYGRAAFGM